MYRDSNRKTKETSKTRDATDYNEHRPDMMYEQHMTKTHAFAQGFNKQTPMTITRKL